MKDKKLSRRQFVKLSGLSLAALPFANSACAVLNNSKNGKSFMVYVGTYAKPDAESIFGYKLNTETGALTRVFGFKGGENPTYLTVDPKRKFLYAVNEITEFRGVKSGAVSGFTINEETGSLSNLNQEASIGTGPCYITTDNSNKLLLVANYGGGSVSVLPIRSNGRVGVSSDTKLHTGSSMYKGTPTVPHAHCIIPDPGNKFAFAVDLGLDKVLRYKLDLAQGKLIPQDRPAYTTVTGAGPRHLTFHPNQKTAYLINELNSTMVALAYNAADGTFTQIQTVSTLPDGFTGESYCADVHVSADGKFLYGSNRGHNSIVVYAIDKNSGSLALVQHVDVQGNWPRNFAIDPSGKILLVANQKSNNVVTFRIAKDTGKLTPTGVNVELPSPVCLKLVSDFS